MLRLRVHVPGRDEPYSATLTPGSALVIGRTPDAARVSSTHGLSAWSVGALPVDSEKVSAQHVLVGCGPEGAWVIDLGSRNGTSLRMRSNAPQTVAHGELVLDLATQPADAGADRPRAADWAGAEDFAERVTDRLQSWFAERAVSMRVTLDASANDGTLRLALATGRTLTLSVPRDVTADTRLPAMLDVAAAYVDEQNALLDQERGHDDDLVIRSARFRDAHRRVYEASVRGRRLLLLGASGTGKERLARCYHLHSPRRDGPFRALNCALMDENLVWVQLFGAARGSYTGSVHEVAGAVELAHGGTLFLDEVAELSTRVQAALLRFLDHRGEFERLGDPKVRRSDVRIVCATNGDLRGAVTRGAFRADLWYRFAGSVVEVPSLRERPEDVSAYLASRSLGPSVSARDALALDAKAVLARHPWPGNFRELENFVARLPLGARAGSVDAATCRELLREGAVLPAEETGDAAPAQPGAWAKMMDEATRAFREDHDGGDPGAYGELRDFFEAYLRPVYVAHAAGLAGATAGAATLNHSAIARQLGIADGTTVRRCVERYLQRFAGR